jgi:hypothetical protein
MIPDVGELVIQRSVEPLPLRRDGVLQLAPSSSQYVACVPPSKVGKGAPKLEEDRLGGTAFELSEVEKEPEKENWW